MLSVMFTTNIYMYVRVSLLVYLNSLVLIIYTLEPEQKLYQGALQRKI